MKAYLFLLLSFVLLGFTTQTSFLNQQKQFQRVSLAIKEKETKITQLLKQHSLTSSNLNLLIVAYKDQEELVLYAKNKSTITYKKIASYPICARSGELGPKRQYGDYQVPEGFYHINRFNPQSNYYLSLGINYPNAADKKKSKHTNLGGDIFIHGSCVTIGCLPMTDDLIKEIYLLAVYAKNNGQSQIPVYIFPFEMSDQNMEIYQKKYANNPSLISFWLNLKTGYDKFIKERKELKVSVDANGNYE